MNRTSVFPCRSHADRPLRLELFHRQPVIAADVDASEQDNVGLPGSLPLRLSLFEGSAVRQLVPGSAASFRSTNRAVQDVRAGNEPCLLQRLP
jgi:hypothetical protein